MVRYPIIILLLALSLSATGQNQISPTAEIESFEYVTIIARQYDGKMSKIYISGPDVKYEVKEFDVLKNESKRFDYQKVIKIIDKYNQEGWTVVNTNMVHSTATKTELFYTYYFLKRKKSH